MDTECMKHGGRLFSSLKFSTVNWPQQVSCFLFKCDFLPVRLVPLLYSLLSVCVWACACVCAHVCAYVCLLLSGAASLCSSPHFKLGLTTGGLLSRTHIDTHPHPHPHTLKHAHFPLFSHPCCVCVSSARIHFEFRNRMRFWWQLQCSSVRALTGVPSKVGVEVPRNYPQTISLADSNCTCARAPTSAQMLMEQR